MKNTLHENVYNEIGGIVKSGLGYNKIKYVLKNIEGISRSIELVYERGHTIDKFIHSDYVAPSKMRGIKAANVKKSLESFSGFDANQSEVWENVNDYQKDFSYYSETSNFSDVYMHKSDEVKSLIEKFQVHKKANGIAVFLRKNLLSIDVFNKTEIYAEYFTKILKGLAFEAAQLKLTNHGLTNAEASYMTQDFFDNIGKLKYNEFDGAGVGIEYRFENKEYTGFTLNYKVHMIHMAVLSISKNN